MPRHLDDINKSETEDGSLVDKLKEMNELKEQGIIDEEEFKLAKMNIIKNHSKKEKQNQRTKSIKKTKPKKKYPSRSSKANSSGGGGLSTLFLIGIGLEGLGMFLLDLSLDSSLWFYVLGLIAGLFGGLALLLWAAGVFTWLLTP